MEDFQSNGRLYMNTLRFFRKKETEDKLRSDSSEGLQASYPAKGMKIRFEKAKGLQLELVGQLRFDHEHDEDINIFSMYGITELNQDILIDERVLGFGDTAVVIVKGDAFTDRIVRECETRGWKYQFGLVDYVDKETHGGYMGPFRKYSDLEYQSEYRVAVRTNLRGPVGDFCIGDIRDISCLCDSKSVKEYFSNAHRHH
jgi:hypothetical protein